MNTPADSGGGLEERLEAMAGWTSWIFALHADLRHRLLQPVIPDYEATDGSMNSKRGTAPHPADGQPECLTDRALTRMISSAVEKNYRPTLVAMPIGHYALNPALPTRQRRQVETQLISGRSTVLILACIEDPIHLTPEGALILTSELARRLPRALDSGR